MVDTFLKLRILISIEDQLMLFMFYLEKRRIVAFNMMLNLLKVVEIWIKLLQTPHRLGLFDNIYHDRDISRLPGFYVFSLLDMRNVKLGIQNAKINIV